jgi:hypothetical protein
MNRRDQRWASASTLNHRRGHDSEQMMRWENEGGAIGHTAGQRPRPFP